MPQEYGDLFAVIGDDPIVENGPNYGSSNYRQWENEVATPALQSRGYTVHSWIMGERDSFGPLSRIVIVTNPTGETERLVYG